MEHKPVKPYGLVSDVRAFDAPEERWNGADGVFFKDGTTRRNEGFQYRSPQPLFAPEAIQNRLIRTSSWWYYAGAGGVGVNLGNSDYDITPGAWPQNVQSALATWCLLNDVPVYNHPDVGPYYHGNLISDPLAPLPGWPAGWSCRVMRSFKYQLLALDVNEGGADYYSQMRWSSSADAGSVPSEWLPTPENDAGDIIFADEPGALLDAQPLGDNLVVYKGAASYLAQYVGGVFVIVQRSFLQNIGVLATGCVAEHKKRHYLVTEGDVLVHDGARSESIADRQVRSAIFDGMSTTWRERAFVLFDSPRNEMHFYFPSATSGGWCDRVARYNVSDGVWAVNQVRGPEVSDARMGTYRVTGSGGTWADPAGITWDQDFGRWSATEDTGVNDQVMLAFATAGELGEPRAGGKAGTEDMPARLAWGEKALNQANRQALVDRIWLYGRGQVTFRVRLGFQNDPSAPMVFTSWQDAALGGFPADFGMKGNLVSVEIETTSDVAWELHGLALDWQDAGQW